MKIKSKFLTGALLTIASLAVVGSVSSTYAWYSYNTKDSLSYHGIASGNSQNLQVKIAGGDWKQSLSSAELVSISTSDSKKCAGNKLIPVSFIANQEEDKTLNDFYGRPESMTNNIYQANAKDKDGNWGYMQTLFNVRCIDPAQSTADSTVYLSQNIYISDLRVIAKDDDSGRDITKAVRIHLSCGDNNYLIAPGYAGSSTESLVVTNLYGKIKSDGTNYDKGVPIGDTGMYDIAYDYNKDQAEDIVYGKKDVTETALTNYAATATFENGKYKQGGFLLGTTPADGTGNCQIVMTVYLQGWDAAVTDLNAGAEFDIGMTIQCSDITQTA